MFCLHEAEPATNENVCDPAGWRFWVIPTRQLDDRLGAQKTVGVSTLDRLAPPVGWSGLRSAVDRAASGHGGSQNRRGAKGILPTMRTSHGKGARSVEAG